MTIQDEMARAIRRAILAKPGDYSPALVGIAQDFEMEYEKWTIISNRIHSGDYKIGDYTKLRESHDHWRCAYKEFQALLAEHADELRAICTENE